MIRFSEKEVEGILQKIEEEKEFAETERKIAETERKLKEKEYEFVRNWSIIIGIMLCCTVVGSIIGVPMLFVPFQNWWENKATASEKFFLKCVGALCLAFFLIVFLFSSEF